jgi:hypothetical protein
MSVRATSVAAMVQRAMVGMGLPAANGQPPHSAAMGRNIGV